MRSLTRTGGTVATLTAFLLSGCGSTETPSLASIDEIPPRYGLYAVDADGEFHRLDGDRRWEIETWNERSDFDGDTAFLVFHRGIATSPKPLGEIIQLYRVPGVRHDVHADGGIEAASRPHWATVEREEFRVPLDFGPVTSRQDAVLGVPRERLTPGLYTLQYRGESYVHASRLGVRWSDANQSAYAVANCVDRYTTESGSAQYRLCSEEAPGAGLRINVTSSQRRSTATGHTLSVEGTIENVSDKPRSVPAMLLTLNDKNGRPVEQRMFETAVRDLAPGESTAFSKELLDPSPDASRVVVAFSGQNRP